MPDTMRAMAAVDGQTELVEVPKPEPGPGNVLVSVVSSAVNPAEEKVIEGGLVGRFLHAKTSPLVLGWDFSGRVVQPGEGVNDLGEGMAVWGHLAFSMSQRQGSFAEYITVPRSSIARKPDSVPHHVAAAAATVAMTSLQSLRDLGRLEAGGSALIVGAGGGVGSVAVGIGKRLGAHVTGVCSTKDVERVRDLGADAVIDRKNEDPFAARSEYDVVFDTPAVTSYSRCAGSLRTGGAYVTTLPSPSLAVGMLRALFSSRRCYFVQVASKRSDLELVSDWLADGLQIPIDSRHRVADLGTALQRQTDSARVGRVCVDVEGGWPT